VTTRRILIAVAAAALLVVPIARADGDPASDYLLSESVFVPPDAGIPDSYAKQLTQVVADAKARGYETRVALIGTRYDLGAIPSLYLKPKQYARFLGSELYFVYKGRLIVVMPNGLGASKGGKLVPADEAVVNRLPPPGRNGAALAATAMKAVVRLAGNSGVVVAEPPLAGGKPASANHDRLEIAIGGAVILGLTSAGWFLWQRRRRVRA